MQKTNPWMAYAGQLETCIRNATHVLAEIEHKRALDWREMVAYPHDAQEYDLRRLLHALQGTRTPAMSDAPVTSEDY